MGDIGISSLPPFTFTNTISGKSHTSESTSVHHGVNPVDKSPLWDVPIASDADVEEAIKAARAAFKPWSQKKWEERQDVLRAMKEEYAKHKDELTKILVLEGGKPVTLPQLWIYEGVINQTPSSQSQPARSSLRSSALTITPMYLNQLPKLSKTPRISN